MTEWYEIRVLGHLSPSFAAVLGDPDAAPMPPQTVLRREISAPAELHETLRQLQELGLELVEVRKLPPAQEPVSSLAVRRRSGDGETSARSGAA
jgi:hypothetical protein